MTRVAALLVAASVFAFSLPAAADGIPRETRPTVAKKIKKTRFIRQKNVIENTAVVEEKAAAPQPVVAPVVAPPVVAPPPTPPPEATPLIWMPGHWTWNAPMNTHVWVPTMYVRPPLPGEEQSLVMWRLGKWIGVGRED